MNGGSETEESSLRVARNLFVLFRVQCQVSLRHGRRTPARLFFIPHEFFFFLHTLTYVIGAVLLKKLLQPTSLAVWTVAHEVETVTDATFL